MKSHDCHVLMTQILPVAIRGIMDAHVRETLFGLCNFFDVISRKSVGVRQLRRLQEEIVVILCELEMYFPPAFFDVMVHLLVHIVEDIIQLGPTFLHSMMPFERMNGVIKGYVRNRARPDGSIAKGFLTEECISFCTSYLEIENPVGLPVNRHLGKLAGWGHRDGSREMHVDFKGRIADFERANLVALQHIDVVDPWVVEHKTFIAKTYSDQGQQRTDGDIIKEHNSTFTRWFKDKMLTYPIDEDSSAEEKLIFALSQGAEHNLMTFQAYDINGYTFYTEEKDMKSDYQNSGVTMESYTGDVKQRYYGKIEEIWELSYAGENVPMFRVRWAKNVIKEDRHFTTMVIPEAKSKTAGAKILSTSPRSRSSTSATSSVTPFELRPIKLLANPVLTCATATDAGYPSNFVANLFLYVQGSTELPIIAEISNMANNEEAGGSGSKPFWMLTDEMEVMESQPRRDDGEDDGTDPEYRADDAAEDDTTDGAGEDDTGAPKKLRRERRPNVLSTVKQAFTEVNASGHPTAPPDLVKGYSAQLGCILRSTVSINTENLRHPDRANLRTLLFKKLHERYEFPVDCSEKHLMRNKVHNAALTKMSTALSSTHKLGPGGFRVAQPKWDAADEERVKNGLEPLFPQYKNKQTRNFLLARYRIDPKTKELTTTPDVKQFEALLAKEIAAESEKEASSGAGSTSSSQCAPWDNPLNRALNAHKKRDPLSKPTSAGRVAGEGCSMKWSDYYKSGKKERKATIDEKEVAQLKAQVAQIPTLVEEQVRQQVQQIVETQQRTQRQQVEDQVGTTLSSLIPTLVAGLDAWYKEDKRGNSPVPSFTGSNSHNVEPSSSAVDVPCTLLHFVNGELIDVAKAKIVQPSNRQLHGRPMQPDVYRIQLVRVLSGYDDVVPPFQPHGADEDEVLTLQHCFNWSMVWPKSQIRLGARDTTPQTAPPAVPAPSHGKTTPTVPPSADVDMQMAQDPNDGPDEDSTFANLDCNFDFGLMDYDLSSQPSQAAAEGKTYCNKRRLFYSQETPPAADFTETQPIAEVRSVISPNTLKKACEEENAVPVNTKPKGRKRKKKDDKSASQPAPIRAQDGPPVPKNIEARVHVSGERMLIQRLYDAAPGPMRSLVDGVMFMEERRLREKDNGYPVYVAKVPSGHGFVDSGFAENIFLRYDDIFAMLNSYPLHYTFICLYSLSKAMRIIRHNIPDIAIADPFYMRAVHLATAGDRAVASGYLKDFFLANQKKCNILLPVFPEDKTCTLISITPKHSVATYLDADGKSTTDYTNVKAVLDDALNGYVKAKGNMQRPNVRYGKHVFKHQTKFPCVKKPPSSNKDAYYALYHMDKFIRDQQQLTLPEHLRDWANKLARVPDDGIKQDFFRIQVEFCEIIHQDVVRSAGEFFAGYQPSNSDIDTMLQMQGDDYRSWMCLKKGGGFIHAPRKS
ncbi:hypothetical protein QYE76_036380 [Lolium multiflorum]|uniref:DUF4218 domain-containing protein n=1 Tax=Lolium multiflorum TaxID=4521 RepID=A0AAD8VM28_LOLMU|nr:hypothetical protein QYE76_036380 [Lolium multiflorum]